MRRKRFSPWQLPVWRYLSHSVVVVISVFITSVCRLIHNLSTGGHPSVLKTYAILSINILHTEQTSTNMSAYLVIFLHHNNYLVQQSSLCHTNYSNQAIPLSQLHLLITVPKPTTFKKGHFLHNLIKLFSYYPFTLWASALILQVTIPYSSILQCVLKAVLVPKM